MKYIKKLTLNTKDPQSDQFSILRDNRIVTNSSASIEVPSGTTGQRPTELIDGTIRYNTTLKEFEVYNSQNPGFKSWEIIRTIRQATITFQDFGYGNYNDVIFGPLSYDIDISKPQNILVFVDNVWQTPNTNYTLTTNPPAADAELVNDTASGTSTLFLSTLTNIDVGTPGVWRTITSNSAGLQSNTTVTNVNFVFDTVNNGYQVGISLPTVDDLASGTTLTASYNPGTYIRFTDSVPAKPVYALLGFDGYFPAGPNRNAFES